MTDLLNAYILHRRSFRNNSVIVDLFTKEQGLICAVARGAKSRQSKLRSALIFFSPMLISTYGKNELLGLKTIELNGKILMPQKQKLLILIYINELLLKLLHKFEAHQALFNAYEQLLVNIMSTDNPEPCLRRFELFLLSEVGYGLNLTSENFTNKPLCHDKLYHFSLESGVEPANEKVQTIDYAKNHYSGKILLAISEQKFLETEVLKAAKCLLRKIFDELLQHRPLQSRQLFNEIKK